VRILAERMADASGVRDNVVLSVQDGRITEVETWNDATQPEAFDVDAHDALLLPGFVDIHVHGGAGRAVMEGTPEALNAVAAHLARHGVTGFLSTTITATWEDQLAALQTVATVMGSTENGRNGAAVLGCHLEGPYINPKRKGAQPGQYILLPDVTDFQNKVGDLLPFVKIVTLAPEMPGALDLIRFLASHGIVASIGHTDATFDEIGVAIEAGARHITHCFNAMTQLGSREPGVVGAALSRSELVAELIWDNVHVHPASCLALIHAKSADGVVLISDGIPGAGMNEGYEFSLGDLPVVVHDGTARLPDGTLAGSILTLEKAFANAHSFTLSERSAMSSRNAAVALGLGHRKGLLVPGFDADLVLLNSDGSVRHTFVAGHCVYSSRKGDLQRQA
jgi:N-acetylglucosamine-6-phosphate deacetylase